MIGRHELLNSEHKLGDVLISCGNNIVQNTCINGTMYLLSPRVEVNLQLN